MLSYKNSLKYYQDMKNSLDTVFDEGKEEGIEVGEQKKKRRIVINGLEQGLDKKVITALTGLSMKAIEKITQDIHEEEP